MTLSEKAIRNLFEAAQGGPIAIRNRRKVELQAEVERVRRRGVRPEPLATVGEGKWAHPIYAHRVHLIRQRGGGAKVTCGQCEFRGTYPTAEHARAVADEHVIHSHVTGSKFCGVRGCSGDAAIKRKALR